MDELRSRYAPAILLGGGIVAGLLASRMTMRGGVRLPANGVLITGGSCGLGLRLAHEFARAGAQIAICARDAEELARAKEDLAGYGVDVLTLECAVASAAQVERRVQAASDHLGRSTFPSTTPV